MTNQTDSQKKKKVKGRVLFTGSSALVIEDILRIFPSNFQSETCAPNANSFLGALTVFRPHAIVICLSNETKEMLRMYAEMQDRPEHYELPCVIIGNKDDTDLFRRNVFQKKTQYFIRPLDRNTFMDKLTAYLSAGTAAAVQAEADAANQSAGEQPTVSPAVSEEELIRQIERMALLDGRKTVLVVDDDVRMLNVIKLYLQDLYEVVVVPSGKLALKYLSKKDADLVLLDYMMPEQDGPEVLQQIRENSPHPDVPVLFLTGVADRAKVLRGLEFHPSGYLLKPVTKQQLLEKATEALLGL